MTFPKETPGQRAYSRPMTWPHFVWSLVVWPLAGAFVLFTDDWRVFWVVWMVVLGMVLAGMRFAGDRLIAAYKETIAIRDDEICHLRRYKQAVQYARGELSIKPPHMRGKS